MNLYIKILLFQFNLVMILLTIFYLLKIRKINIFIFSVDSSFLKNMIILIKNIILYLYLIKLFLKVKIINYSNIINNLFYFLFIPKDQLFLHLNQTINFLLYYLV
jgi:hypothetical protein